jgi:adenylate cyclase
MAGSIITEAADWQLCRFCQLIWAAMQNRAQLRRIRLVSGLILFVYVATHFLNHALGLISHQALADGRGIFLFVWRNPLGTIILYGAVIAHLALAIWSFYQRRSLRGLSRADWAQMLLGLAIPPLILMHLLGTRVAHQLFGTEDNYDYVLLIIWVFLPMEGLLQLAALVAAWLHGCIGLRGWLRLKPWYPAAQPYLFAGALLLPTLAILGTAAAGREVATLYLQPGWYNQVAASVHFADPQQLASLYAWRRILLAAYGAILLATIAARHIRNQMIRRQSVEVTYPDGKTVELHRGSTILEASRQAGIPHASVCGGRGRCSTCRVQIVRGLDDLPPASPEERRVLERVGAPPGVRLACQTRPSRPVAIVPLLPATATPRDGRARPGYLQGHEQEIAILFADLRGFTGVAHRKLPYDTVFLLNRYFRAMGMAVDSAGGHLDKFIGDGVMALFGIASDPADGCRRALAAARQMSLNLAELNRSLAHDLGEPLRIGIGIHVGPAIVGEMGYARATTLTAVGDAVNTASRLETLTKEYGAELVLSQVVADRAGLALQGHERHAVTLRGRDHPLAVIVVKQAADLPEAPEAPEQKKGRGDNPGMPPRPAAIEA